MEWARDHRVHHKYSETNADPHNAKRGFFFSHVGWLLCRKHPDVIEKGRKIDLSDLQADPVVAFQKRHYLKTVLICCFIFPAVIPMFLWGETFLNAFVICSLTRYNYYLRPIKWFYYSTGSSMSINHIWQWFWSQLECADLNRKISDTRSWRVVDSAPIINICHRGSMLKYGKFKYFGLSL